MKAEAKQKSLDLKPAAQRPTKAADSSMSTPEVDQREGTLQGKWQHLVQTKKSAPSKADTAIDVVQRVKGLTGGKRVFVTNYPFKGAPIVGGTVIMDTGSSYLVKLSLPGAPETIPEPDVHVVKPTDYIEKKPEPSERKSSGESEKEEFPAPKLKEFEQEATSEDDFPAIMNKINFKAAAKGLTLGDKKSSTSIPKLALACTHGMEQLVNEARQKMEGRTSSFRMKGSRALIFKAVAQTIEQLNAMKKPGEGKAILARLYAHLIAAQLFTEGNNRATYIVIVMLGSMYGVPIPLAKEAATRSKKSFSKGVIAEQYMEMYKKGQVTYKWG